jgi:hypothetical protein
MGTDISKAFEIENGLLFEEGAYLLSGDAIPVGIDCPIGSFYIHKTLNGFDLWEKKGVNNTDWFIKDILDPNDILVDSHFDVIADEDGNVLTE